MEVESYDYEEQVEWSTYEYEPSKDIRQESKTIYGRRQRVPIHNILTTTYAELPDFAVAATRKLYPNVKPRQPRPASTNSGAQLEMGSNKRHIELKSVLRNIAEHSDSDRLALRAPEFEQLLGVKYSEQCETGNKRHLQD
jgi:hypothetical protein